MTYEELHDIVLQHGKSIYSFCRYLTANADLADDLYQETFSERDFPSSAYPRWYSQKQALACKTHIKKGTGGTWI